MRLGQLARQLDIKPEKIVSYLEKEKDLIIKSHPNAKVEDELIEEISTHFNPVIIESEPKAVAIKEEAKEEAPIEQKESEHIETVKSHIPQELKIIGKIDLPNKSEITVEVDGVVYDQETLDNKKKEDLKAERERKALEKEVKKKEELEKRKKAQEQKKIEQERLAMLETEKDNILTKEEEKRKAIILKTQEERERKMEEKRKKRQKDNYLKNHAIKTNAAKSSLNKDKAVKKVDTIKEKKATVENPIEKPVETNVFKRFLKWLNT